MNYNSTVNAKSEYFSTKPPLVKRGTTFAEFRELARRTRQDLLADNESMKTEIESVIKIYRKDIAAVKIDELRTAYQGKVADKSRELRESLSHVKEAKESALTDFITAPPSQDILNTLTAVNIRGNISEAELGMLIKRCAGNYQSLSLLSSIAEKSGVGFSMPLKAENISENLDKAYKMCDGFIEHVGQEDKSLGYTDHEFFYGSNDVGFVPTLLKALDDDPSVMVSAEKPSILQELESARTRAMTKANESADGLEKVKALSDVSKIDRFVSEHGDDLISDKDIDESRSKLIAEAEGLIGKTE